MTERKPHRIVIDVCWKCLACLVPVWIFVPGAADVYGAYFGACAICLPIGLVSAEVVELLRPKARAHALGQPYRSFSATDGQRGGSWATLTHDALRG